MSTAQHSIKVTNLSESDIRRSITLAKNLRLLREQNGLSHARLSAKLEEEQNISISANSLMNYEVTEMAHSRFGKNLGMSVQFLSGISCFYGVSIDFLVGLTNDPTPKKSVVDKLSIAPVAVGLLEKYRDELEGRGLAKLCEYGAFLSACAQIGKLIKVCSKQYAPGREVQYDGVENPELIERLRAEEANHEIRKNYHDLADRAVFLSGADYKDYLATHAQNLFVRAVHDIIKNTEQSY